MKNKKWLIILLPATIGIWGYVAFQIYSTLNKGGSVGAESKLIIHKASNKVNDVFSLKANYSDPFLGSIEVNLKPTAKIQSSIKNKNEGKSAQVSNLSICYLGLIKNNRKQVAILQINGNTQNMKVGDQFEQITLLAIFRDSVKIKKFNQTIFVKKDQKNIK